MRGPRCSAYSDRRRLQQEAAAGRGDATAPATTPAATTRAGTTTATAAGPAACPRARTCSGASDGGADFCRASTLDQVNQERPLDDVFFDLDLSTLREDAKAPLQKDADWMKKWPSTQVIVEGHADARGSAEYNLALGARRAEVVKQYSGEPRRAGRSNHGDQQR